VPVPANYSFAVAYCAKKEMTLAPVETEAEFIQASSVAKGKFFLTKQ